MKAFEIQQARRFLGMTQPKFATAVGVSQRMIRYYETGRFPVPFGRATLIGFLVEKKEREDGLA